MEGQMGRNRQVELGRQMGERWTDGMGGQMHGDGQTDRDGWEGGGMNWQEVGSDALQ